MRSSTYLLIPLLMALACCNEDYILETPPFQNLTCASDVREFASIQKRAGQFAKRNQFSHRSNEFSSVLVTPRLNFVITYAPDAPVFVTGIARTPASTAEKALFNRFVASLPLRCSSART